MSTGNPLLAIRWPTGVTSISASSARLAEIVSAGLHTEDCSEYGCAHRIQRQSLKALIPQAPQAGCFGIAIAISTAESRAVKASPNRSLK
jgi:hypothetical protein